LGSAIVVTLGDPISQNAVVDHYKHMSEMPAYQRLTARDRDAQINFAKKIIAAMISEEDRPEFRGGAFRIKHL
jgi:hypothetical protein